MKLPLPSNGKLLPLIDAIADLRTNGVVEVIEIRWGKVLVYKNILRKGFFKESFHNGWGGDRWMGINARRKKGEKVGSF